MTTEQIAQIAHEVNRAYCRTLGDLSQPVWEETPEWQRRSAVQGVAAIQQHPDQRPEQSHVNWLQTKQAEGWTYGPVKDPERRQHPCMRPYADLPTDQRRKDHLFTAVVRACLQEL